MCPLNLTLSVLLWIPLSSLKSWWWSKKDVYEPHFILTHFQWNPQNVSFYAHFICHLFYLSRCTCNCSFRILFSPQMSPQLLSVPKGIFHYGRSHASIFVCVLFSVLFEALYSSPSTEQGVQGKISAAWWPWDFHQEISENILSAFLPTA